MSVLAGDLPGYEEATRALFAHDYGRLNALMADWRAKGDLEGLELG